MIVLALLLLFAGQPAQAASSANPFRGLHWGEGQRALLAHFGGAATVLAQPLDFGDSYAQIVLRDVDIGGVKMIGYLQIDKRTGGLKRIQLERPRHGVNPPAFRDVVGALVKAYGKPAATCEEPPASGNGYQASVELDWSLGGNLVRAIFRDTTLEAFEGCWWDWFAQRPCGLTGQMLVRLSPPGADRPGCSMTG
jgi:hypothetical protein